MKTTIIFLLFQAAVFAQGEFIDRGFTAFGVDEAYAANNNSNSLGTEIGISLFGYVDLGFAFESTLSNIEYSDSDIKTTSNLFSIGYNIKRKNNTSNLKISLGYMTSSVEQRDIDLSGVLLSLAYSMRIYENEGIILMPHISLTYGFLSASVDNNSYSSESSFDDSRSLSAGFSFAPRLTEGLYLIITPSIMKDLLNPDNSLFFGVSGGFLLSVKNE